MNPFIAKRKEIIGEINFFINQTNLKRDELRVISRMCNHKDENGKSTVSNIGAHNQPVCALCFNYL